MGSVACAQCPWRLSNQGKKHKSGFYTAKNLRRLWNQIRNGGNQQSCHLTDPSHPDHIEAGAKPGARAKECPGSVLVVLREVSRMADAKGVVTPEGVDRYAATRKGGLTKQGIRYWCIQRIAMGHVALLGGPPMPDVADDPAVGLPEALR